MKTATSNKLKECKTVNDFFTVLNSDYKTEDCKPGFITKATLHFTIAQMLPIKNPIQLNIIKETITKTETLQGIAERLRPIVGEIEFTADGKKELPGKTEALITLTQLKER